MSQQIRSLLFLCSALGLLALGACDRSKDEPAVDALVSDASLLRYVPADSPYVLASMEPMPDELLDKLEPRVDRILKAYEALLLQVVEQGREDADDIEVQGANTETLESLAAVGEELATLMSIEGLRGVGIDRDSTAVIYGNGLLPVLRMTLSDPALMEAEFVRLEEKASKPMAVQTIGDQKIRFFEAEEWRVLVALVDKQLVVSSAPAAFDDDQVAALLGLTAPDESIADAGTLGVLAERYDYGPYMVGYVDFEAIAETFIAAPQGLNAALFASVDPDSMRPELSDVCKQEVRGMVAVAPRLVFGYTDVTADAVDSHGILELQGDIASGLAALPAAVPGLGVDNGGLFSFGMSLDLMAARNFYEARLDALDAEPFECDTLAPMVEGLMAGRAALQQPVPPMVYDFRGFKAEISDVEGLDLQSGRPPERVDGRVVLAMENAPALLALGAMFSPELAALQPEPGGEPVRVEAAQLAGIVDAVYVALDDDAIGLSFGADMQQGLTGMMAADPAPDGTVMSFSMDAGRYYALIGEAAALGQDDGSDELPPEMQAMMREVMLSFSELYDRMNVSVRLTERGIEFDSGITIKE